ncbi:VRR-NUC domain-containing protein [Pararobbsia silviterrae]|uniref:phosphodiesterase I n=1 Tax=Pararobbsia silviterrae TaxID=1792498 RepID=A0A494XYP4_9BURK|nr:VRR-NUC domain-containing protein [Pararobbsia silviterrae]RKP55674.1 VRR-NUC domain-containing protein [Pararobbsia silviterrae]
MFPRDSPTVTPSDPRYYYLANFERALAWIAQRYDDLLVQEETDFLRAFAGVPLASRALLVRMLMRRGDVFRTSRLDYDEIGDTQAAIAPLAALGWIDTTPVLDLDLLFTLLTKPELRAIFGNALDPAARKAEWLAHLGATHTEPRPYSAWRPDAPDAVIRVTSTPLCERLRVMFFGNAYQQWSEFVLADLGIYRYEPVEFDVSSRAFQSRDDIDTYLGMHACRAALELGDALDLDAVLQAVHDAQSDNAWLETRRAKLFYQIGQHCERLRDWDRARIAYRASSYPGARHRLIRVLELSACIDDAWTLALDAMHTPRNDEERQRVARMMPRLKRLRAARGEMASHARFDVIASEAPAPIARIDRVLPRPRDGERVEWVALNALTRDDAPVHYVENTLLNALFGLLCWPAIFAPVPGAFFHPFQSGPADLHAPDFEARRATIFAACFAELESDAYRATILERFTSKYGIQSPFVAWPALSADLLTLALDCIPAADLARCFERLLSDIQANRSGLPDLIQFWPAERRYRLIEVKGPGDRLQDNQLRWIGFCGSHGVPVDVLHVTWRDEADNEADDDADDATRGASLDTRSDPAHTR